MLGASAPGSAQDVDDLARVVPDNLGYSEVFSAGGKAYPVSSEGLLDWGFRSSLTLLFPTN
jgi:hypothetical protein